MTLVVLPARLKSTRLPEKMLRKIAGKELILWTLDQAKKIKKADKIVVATDSAKIAKVVEPYAEVMMTDENLPSGTDRAAEVLKKYPSYKLIVNFQADEPLLDGALVDDLLENFPSWADVGTLVYPMKKENEENPNAVKVVMKDSGEILYFSRLPIPYNFSPKLHHIGLYLYRQDALKKFIGLPRHPVEASESLEQLRGLMGGLKYYGRRINDPDNQELNTPEDLKILETKLGKA